MRSDKTVNDSMSKSIDKLNFKKNKWNCYAEKHLHDKLFTSMDFTWEKILSLDALAVF